MINFIQKVSAIRLNPETLLFCILLILGVFYGFGIDVLYILSGLMLMFFSSFSLLLLKDENEERKLFWLILCWLAYHIICALCSLSLKSSYTCFQHVGILTIFTMLINADTFRLQRMEIKGLCKIIHYVVLLALSGVVFLYPNKGEEFESFVYIGLVFLPFAMAKWTKNRGPLLVLLCLLWSFIAFQIGARSQSVGFLVFVFFALFLLAIGNNGKKFVKKLFGVYYVCLNIFPMIYSFLSLSQYRSTLEEFSDNLTKARFFSGRDKLWLSVYDNMNDLFSWLFGLGFNETEMIIEQKRMSLHNLYVTLLSEGGIVLVVLMGLLLNEIWKKLVDDFSFQSKLILSFIIVFLYKQSFDVCLVENNLCVAFAVWTVFAIAYADAKRKVYVAKKGLR